MAVIRKSESGQVMVLAAGAMLLIIGMAALAVDFGSLYATRRNMQTAADAAAIAGANALETNCGTTADCDCSKVTACTNSGADVATLNGYTNGGANSTTVTVGPPTTAPDNVTGGTFVQATVSQAVPTYFMRALGFPTVNVSATAIAGFAPVGPCMTSTDKTDSHTIEVSGSASVDTACEIIDESSNSDGLDTSGGAIVDASAIALVATSWSGDDGHVTPKPSTKSAIPANPYADLVPPSQCSPSGGCNAACDQTGFKAVLGSTASPGVYCQGIVVPAGASLSLRPGTYILVGGNGDMVSGSGFMTGSGVTFYNTYSGKYAYKGITFSGSSKTTLSAPTSGAYANILFYQDPSVAATGNSSNGSSITGSSGASLTGVLYFPTTMLTFSGGTTTQSEDVSLYAYMINITGNANISNAGGGPGQTPTIASSRLYQ
jgi:Flp pilus assembly protein TadG